MAGRRYKRYIDRVILEEVRKAAAEVIREAAAEVREAITEQAFFAIYDTWPTRLRMLEKYTVKQILII